MTMRLSKLFGMDIYTTDAEYRGKVFDIVINLEKGKLETITTEPLKARSKQEAKKIISEKSIPYRNVRQQKTLFLFLQDQCQKNLLKHLLQHQLQLIIGHTSEDAEKAAILSFFFIFDN